MQFALFFFEYTLIYRFVNILPCCSQAPTALIPDSSIWYTHDDMSIHWYLSVYSQAIVAGVMLGVSLLYPVLWPLVIVGTVLTLRLIGHATTTRHAVLGGCVVGVVKMALALVWFWAAYPLTWLGLESGVLQIVVICLYWLPAALTLGSGTALFAYIYFKYIKEKDSLCVYLLLTSFVWMVSEVLGALFFSLYTLGPGSTLTAAFSFGYTGYALAQYDVLFIPFAFLGVYGLSFLVGLLGAGVYKLYTNRIQNRFGIVLAVVVCGFIPLELPITASDIQVALVETHFPVSGVSSGVSPADQKQSLIDAVEAAVSVKTEYILLPEDSRFTTYFLSPNATLDYLQSITDHPIVLVDSARYDSDGTTVLRAYIYDTQAEEVYFFDKQYLVPQGEYVPYIYQSLLDFLQPTGRTLTSLHDTTYLPGINQTTLLLPPAIPAVLFCFESVSPLGVHTVLKNRTEVPFVAHIVSHAWFNRQPHVLWNQLAAMLRTQARMNGIPILQAANEAPLAVYLPSGQIITPEKIIQEVYWSLAVVHW